MQEKAAGVGFDFQDADDAWEKVEEEMGEFREAVDSGDEDAREDEFGDLLFALVNYARYAGVNPENALRRTNNKFSFRVGYIERSLAKQSKTLDEVTLAEAEELWNEAKAKEHATD